MRRGTPSITQTQGDRSMSDAFEEYHRVVLEDGTQKIVFMSWAAYFDPTLEKLMKGPMLRLEVHDADPEDTPVQVSPLNTGETWQTHADPALCAAFMAEWLSKSRI